MIQQTIMTSLFPKNCFPHLFLAFAAASLPTLAADQKATTQPSNLNSEFDEYFPVGDPSKDAYGESRSESILEMFDGRKQKYFNNSSYGKDYPGSGLIIYPRAGRTMLRAFHIRSAEDAPQRDPSLVTVEGTRDGGRSFEVIAKELPVPPFTARKSMQTVALAPTNSYDGYKVTFPAVAGGRDFQIGRLDMEGLITERSVTNPFSPLSGDMVWYNRPGQRPETEGMPVGNGRIGALLLGGYPKDRIVFNESSLWTGDENPTCNYDTMGSYERFGEVNLAFDNPGQITRYRRALDLKTATATVDYLVEGVHFHREVFASNPGQIIAMRMTADKPGSYSGTLSVKDGHPGTVTLEGNHLVIRGTLPNGEIYESRLAVEAKGGSLEVEGDALRFRNCDSLTLYLAARTNYVMDASKKYLGPDPRETVAEEVKGALSKGFEKLRAAHIADYSPRFDRVAINLGKSASARIRMPSDQRRTEDKDGLDPEFEALLFQYGRYLLLASVRPGGLPANLNGLWCDNGIICHSDYHSNINIQECHWQAEVTGLPECHMPFFDLTDSQLPLWRKLEPAEKKYNAGIPPEKIRGFDIRTSHNIRGGQGWLRDRAANAWYCMHYWEHYAYTQNKEFLRNRAWPIMREVSQYWADHLKALPDGRLVVPDGWSPEQGGAGISGDGTTYQQELVYNVLDHTVQAAKILGIDDEETRNFAVLRDKLLLPAIGSRGQLQEWMEDIDSNQIRHRHTSQLIGLFPGERITPDKTPDAARAAAVSLIDRGIVGNTEWTLPWRAALWARLGKGNAAHELLERFISDGFIFPNLFANCGSAETDGNGAYTGAVAEMLLQSHRKAEWSGKGSGAPYLIELLPALPEAWETGSVKGLRARGGLTVDIDWKNGKVTNYRITSAEPREVKVRVNGETKNVRSEKS
jgi:alpha-L-fucosidase 2